MMHGQQNVKFWQWMVQFVIIDLGLKKDKCYTIISCPECIFWGVLSMHTHSMLLRYCLLYARHFSEVFCVYTWHVSYIFCRCTQHVCEIFCVYTWHVSGVFCRCIEHVSEIFCIWTQSVCEVFCVNSCNSICQALTLAFGKVTTFCWTWSSYIL
jgi:hypothetical protein